jgi:hypothetical protein
MGDVTRLPSGLSTAGESDPLANFGMPDPTKWHVFFEDFDYYLASDWTITAVGTGTSALTDLDGGNLLVTNSGLDNDGRQHQKLGSGFLLSAGKKAFFKARFKAADVTQSDIFMGLAVTDTTLLGAVAGDGATDGIFFQKDDGVATLDVYCQKDTTTGQASSAAIATLVNDTFVTVAWYFDAKQNLTYFIDGVAKGKLAATSATLPDVILTPSFAVLNGEAVAKTLTVDYLFVALER